MMRLMDLQHVRRNYFLANLLYPTKFHLALSTFFGPCNCVDVGSC